jgi:hypothetical protein
MSHKSYFLSVFFIVIVSTLLLSSCNKNGGITVPATKQLVYFNLYEQKKVGLYWNAPITCKRICYDVLNKNIVWERPNEIFMYDYSWNYNIKRGGNYVDFEYEFSSGQYLLRIFASSTGVSDYGDLYIDKIDKTNGDLIFRKKIIDSSQFDHNKYSPISPIIYKNDRFYFGTNVGKLYCFDESGNQVWVNNDFNMSGVPANYPLIYAKDRLFFVSRDNYSSSQWNFKILSASLADGSSHFFCWTDTPTGLGLFASDSALFSYDESKFSIALFRDSMRSTTLVPGSHPYRPLPIKLNPFISYYVKLGNPGSLGAGGLFPIFGNGIWSNNFDAFTTIQDKNLIIAVNPKSLSAYDSTQNGSRVWTFNPFSGVPATLPTPLPDQEIDYILKKDNQLFLMVSYSLQSNNLIDQAKPPAMGINVIDTRSGAVVAYQNNILNRPSDIRTQSVGGFVIEQ